MKKIIYSILVISIMVIIFMFSNQEANVSSKMSDGFIDRTVVKVYKLFNGDATIEQIDEVKEFSVPPIRKLAHVTIYFLLGILVLLLINEFKLSYRNIIIISLIICVTYSISDEIHQLFIPGRSGQISDVILDSCSSFIGIILSKKLIKNDMKEVNK